MFVKNKFNEEKIVYVNGTTGVVVDFDESNYLFSSFGGS
jgi:hypothetical protein